MDTILGKLFDEEEIDMRDGLSDLIAGNDFTEKKGLIFVHRKMRRDANDNRIRCSCNTGPSRDGHKDCPYCFTEDANVLTERGYIGIKDVRVGDKVLGKDGTYHPVTSTMQREYNGKLIRLTTFLRAEPITCTHDHVWFVIKREDYQNRRFIISESDAGSLDIGDYLLMPKISDSELSDITEIEIGDRKVRLTDDFLWVMGLWCAEGHIHNGRDIYWSLNLSEIEYAKKVESVFSELFPDCNIRHYEFPEKNVRQVAVAKADIARWFSYNFKEGCDNKSFPGWLMRLPNERIMNAFNGLWAGDGSTTHKDKDRMTDRCSLGMTSREIIYQAQWILWRNGRYAGLSTHKTSGKRQVWRVEWIENARVINQTKGFSEFENFYATKIRKIESYNDSTMVYDITVDGTHSFIVNNTLTHNCDGVGYLWDEKFIRSFIYNKRYMSMADSTTFYEEMGRANTESFIFITKHTNMLYEGDYIIEYSKDDTGKVKFPFIVDTKFIVTASKEMGAVRNLNEYILATANVVFRHDYNRL